MTVPTVNNNGKMDLMDSVKKTRGWKISVTFVTILCIIIISRFSLSALIHEAQQFTTSNQSKENIHASESTNVPHYAYAQQGRKHITSYHFDKEKFVETVAKCMVDDFCHIQFLHTQKTGGTSINRMIGKVLPYEGDVDFCCDKVPDDVLLKERCLNPYASYQIFPDQFMNGVLSPCLELYTKLNAETGSRHRAIAMATIREPLVRLLSDVHETCNKHAEWRNPATLEICDRCDYEADKTWWTAFADKSENRMISFYEDYIIGTETDKFNIPVLVLDTVDLQSFFSELVDTLPHDLAEKFRQLDSHANQSDHGEHANNRCEFGMNVDVMKTQLQSLEVYRKVTLGI